MKKLNKVDKKIRLDFLLAVEKQAKSERRLNKGG